MSFESEEVRVVDADGVRAITINRPNRLNAITTEIVDAITAAVESSSLEPGIRVVTLTGAGRAFCAGADISTDELDAAAEGAPNLPSTDTIDAVNRLALAIRALPKVVVALVNGPAVGVGSSFVLAADLAIASDAAYLKPGFEAIGLMPDGGGSVFLPAAVGRARALRIILLGDRISAMEALDIGLVARVFAADTFEQDSKELVQRIVAGAPLAQAAAKEAVNRISLPALAEGLEFERLRQRDLLGSADFAEGIAAFAEKRSAVFAGS